MNRKSNGHSANYIKDQARQLQKKLGISYYEALNKVSQSLGFTSYKNFHNQSIADVSSKASLKATLQPADLATHSKIAIPLPDPLVVNFGSVLGNARYQRPNARMSIAAHKEIGGLLKTLKKATENNKRAYRHIADVAFQLDEWGQREYRSRAELSDDEFFDLYYGNIDTKPELSPSQNRMAELRHMCRKVKGILRSSYHDCKPLVALFRQMDLAIKHMEVWPVAKGTRSGRRDVKVPAGSLVYINGNHSKPAILISHDVYTGSIVCYSDRGEVTYSREGVSVPKDQSVVVTYRPMRLWLPYGKAIAPDGTEVLFNRDYLPLWQKMPDGRVGSISPQTWYEKSSEEYYFKDGSAPWLPDKKTKARCIEVLKEWGVEELTPELLALLPVAISKNDASLLRPDRRKKQ